jgi:hypothetical protein
MSGNFTETATQVLAIFGAVALLLTFCLGGLVVRTTLTSNGQTEMIRGELNRQFLIFSLLITVLVGLVAVGVPVLLALAIDFALMLIAYRWLQHVLLITASGAVFIFVLQILFR